MELIYKSTLKYFKCGSVILSEFEVTFKIILLKIKDNKSWFPWLYLSTDCDKTSEKSSFILKSEY